MAQVQSGYKPQNSNAVINAKSITALKAKAARTLIAPQLSGVEPIRISGLYGHNPLQNRLLASLPASDFERLLPHLEFVHMPFDMTLCETHSQTTHVYFPTSSIVSLLHETQDGNSAETATIGNEGVVGVNLFMGGGKSTSRVSVKCGGYGFRLRANILMEEFARGGVLQQSLLRYTQALIAHMSQTAVCNRHHGVSQQLWRWLLVMLDRLPDNDIRVTQSLIATMLGVRRESIAEAAGKLQDEGAIRYSRGHITVLNRKMLEARACECYQGMVDEYESLFAVKN